MMSLFSHCHGEKTCHEMEPTRSTPTGELSVNGRERKKGGLKERINSSRAFLFLD